MRKKKEKERELSDRKREIFPVERENELRDTSRTGFLTKHILRSVSL